VSYHRVLVIMGSETDREVMESARPYFDYFGINADFRVSSAHRAPDQTVELARNARDEGYSVIVAAAGMAAHLAGVCTANSDLPVIGVPLDGSPMGGLDALLATVQMPAGVPVATLAIGRAGAINSAILCARILSLTDQDIHRRLADFRAKGCRLPKA